jgi:DNA mismatch repair protein MutS2
MCGMEQISQTERQASLLKKSREKLEYPEVIRSLENLAVSEEGKSLCRNLLPETRLSLVEENQEDTADALEVLLTRSKVPLQGLHKIRPQVLRATMPGAVLDTKDLLHIASFLEAVERLADYVPDEREDEEAGDNRFYQILMELRPQEKLRADIRSAILAEDEISDDASPELRRLRRSRAKIQEQIRKVLERILRDKADLLQDAIITLRQNRYVIPVKAQNKAQIAGLVHDSSNSGQTLFVEPLAVVEQNNKIREILIEEDKEIQRILEDFTKRVGAVSQELIYDIDLMARADFLMAKAKLAKAMSARRPDLNEEGIIDLRKARHPHIPANEVVPIDIHVGEDFHTLLITGPNTGGKTVALKTIGLLSLMAMAGLHIPCDRRSRLSVFDQVLADIGDEQSIEQSLSTFSSHMRNIVDITDLVNDRSLVLTDELGSGTDPAEGAALAIAILQDFKRAGAITVATTHYKELKLYALETPGVENASCEFDTESLKPTYRILVGVPGTSHAFVISRKLGLREEIIEDAGSKLSEEAVAFEEVLGQIEERRIESQKLLDQAAEDEKKWRLAKAEMEEELKQIKASKSQILHDAREEARKSLKDQIRQLDQLVKDLESTAGRAALEDAQALRQMVGGELNQIENEIGAETLKQLKEKSKTSKSLKPGSWEIGDTVFAPALGLEAKIVSEVDNKGQVQIRAGQLQVNVPASGLERVDQRKTAKRSAKGKATSDKASMSGGRSGRKISSQARLNFSPEINIIGKTTDEGVRLLDAYLDEAVLAGASQIRIVHGKGTGALREAVQGFLRYDSRVKSFELAAFGEGDAGVTLAKLV